MHTENYIPLILAILILLIIILLLVLMPAISRSSESARGLALLWIIIIGVIWVIVIWYLCQLESSFGAWALFVLPFGLLLIILFAGFLSTIQCQDK